MDDVQCPVKIPGYFHHGNCDLLCRPAAWTDILIFYIGNYIAHAATLTSLPGQSAACTLATILTALVLPGAGIFRAIDIIESRAIFAPTSLQTAARAGALCAVIRQVAADEAGVHSRRANRGQQLMGFQQQLRNSRRQLRILRQQLGTLRQFLGQDVELQRQETPGNQAAGSLTIKGESTGVTAAAGHVEEQERLGQTAHDAAPLLPRKEPESIRRTKIHGRCNLPEGFDLVVVPRTATFESDDPDKFPLHRRLLEAMVTPSNAHPTPRTVICCNYNVVKVIVSIVQLLFAISTLYKTRGDQVDMYGYAAFGLTVAPYAWMDAAQLGRERHVPTERLNRGTEDERANFMIEGTVGRLTESAEEQMRQGYLQAREVEDSLARGIEDFLARGVEHARRPQPATEPGSSSPLLLDVLKVLAKVLVIFLVSCIQLFMIYAPLVIVGVISRFQANKSAYYQRVWTMTWLAFGQFLLPMVLAVGGTLESRPILNEPDPDGNRTRPWYKAIYVGSAFAAPAIGGYVVVAGMIKEFGVCSALG